MERNARAIDAIAREEMADPHLKEEEFTPDDTQYTESQEKEARFAEILRDFEDAKQGEYEDQNDEWGDDYRDDYRERDQWHFDHPDVYAHQAPAPHVGVGGLFRPLDEDHDPALVEAFVHWQFARGKEMDFYENWEILGKINADVIMGALAELQEGHELFDDFFYHFNHLHTEGAGFKKLLDKHPELVLQYLSAFSTEAQEEIAVQLKGIGRMDLIAKYIRAFDRDFLPLAHLKEEALSYLVEKGSPKMLAESIRSFDTLPEEAVNKLIDGGYADELLNQAHRLREMDWNAIVHRIIEQVKKAQAVDATASDTSSPPRFPSGRQVNLGDLLRAKLGVDPQPEREESRLGGALKSIYMNLGYISGLNPALAIELMTLSREFGINKILDNLSSFKVEHMDGFVGLLLERAPSKHDFARNFPRSYLHTLKEESRQKIGKRFLAYDENLSYMLDYHSTFALSPEDIIKRFEDAGRAVDLLRSGEHIVAKLDVEKIVMDAIHAGKINEVCKSIEYLPEGSFSSTIAEQLIAAGRAEFVFAQSNSFRDFTGEAHLEKLIAGGEERKALGLISKVRWKIPVSIYLQLLERGGCEVEIMNLFQCFDKTADPMLVIGAARKKNIHFQTLLGSMHDIPQEELMRMIKEGETSPALWNSLRSFRITHWESVIEALVDARHSRVAIDILRGHTNGDLPGALALRFVALYPNWDNRLADNLLSNMTYFNDFPHNLLVEKIVEQGTEDDLRTLRHHLPNMRGLDPELAIKLLEKGREFNTDIIFTNLSSFAFPDKIAFIEHLLGRVPLTCDVVKAFPLRILDLSEDEKRDIGRLFLKGDNDVLSFMLSHFEVYNIPPDEIIRHFAEVGMESDLLYKSLSLPGLDIEGIFTRAIGSGNARGVAHTLRYQGENTISARVAEQLITAGCLEDVFGSLKVFKDFDSADYLEKRINEGEEGATAAIELISLGDRSIPERICRLLIEKGGYERELMDHFYCFKDADPMPVIEAARQKKISINEYVCHLRNIPDREALRLIKEGNARVIMEYWESFNITQLEEFTRAMIEAGEPMYALRAVDYAEGVENVQLSRDLAERFIEEIPRRGGDYVTQILSCRYRFHDFPNDLLARNIIKTRHADLIRVLCDYISEMKDLSNVVAQGLIERGLLTTVIRNFKSFQGLGREVADDAISRGLGLQVLLAYRSFEGLERGMFEDVFKGLAFKDQRAVNQLFDPPFDPALAWFEDNLPNCGKGLYEVVSSMKSGAEPSPEMMSELETLGVSKFDEKGLTQLLDALRARRQTWVNSPEEIPVGEIASHKLLFEYFKDFIRFDDAQWGSKDDSSFRDFLFKHKEKSENGELPKLPAAYVPSPIERVKLVDREEVEAYKFTNEGTERYRSLLESMTSARSQLGEKKVLSNYAARIEERRASVVDELEKRMETLENPKGRKFLDDRIRTLKAVSVRSVKDLEKNLGVLLDFNEFGELIRQAVFYMAFMNERAVRDMPLEDMKEISFDNISSVINFVDHITNQEVVHRYFKDNHVVKKFEGLLGTRALGEEMSRAQNATEKSTTPMRFTPTRGVLNELSGSICDACWADHQGSIGQDFPNFSTLVMSQYPGNPKLERIVGATILIETESAKGEPLLVIRGLNPIESYINRLSVPDFMRTIVTYLEGIATASGRKLALVNDGARGRAGTNRQVVFDFMKKMRPNLTQVKLKGERGTTFNRYNIVNDCYLISSEDLLPDEKDKVASNTSPK